VPAVLGAAGLAGAATVLMPSAATVPTQATTLLPSAAPLASTETVEEISDEPPTTKKRSPWTWPLIALIALLALVLIGTIIALVAQPKAPPSTPTTAAVSPAPSVAPSTPSPTPTSTTVQINEADFLGLTADAARAKLQSLGMVANVQPGNAATKQAQVNTVYSVNPTGPVPRGSEITLKVYGAVTPIPTPTDKVSASPDTAAPNSTVTVTFGSAACPAGQALVGRQLYVDGKPQTPVNATSTTWTATTPGDHQFTYTIFCGEAVESGQSPALSYTVAGSTAVRRPRRWAGPPQGDIQ
jgi:serine/threonine-protein kinase